MALICYVNIFDENGCMRATKSLRMYYSAMLDHLAIHVGLHYMCVCGCYARAFAKQTLHVQPL